MAVALALANDVEVALLQQLVAEQRQAAAEVFWEYSPDLSLEAGVGSGRHPEAPGPRESPAAPARTKDR
ncbi:MAG: hypothetical protein FJY95_18600 [Candidatus Handelsmanbacteria bacterium]|nr:hypothetical protein [Candidatus Handelsmanbacteria bacterium]